MTLKIFSESERITVKYGLTELYRDLHKYKDTPEVAILKHFSLSDLIHNIIIKKRQEQDANAATNTADK
jgi:hypothetical protein